MYRPTEGRYIAIGDSSKVFDMHVTTAVQYFSSPSINDIRLTLKAKQTLCSRTATYVLKIKTGHFKSKVKE